MTNPAQNQPTNPPVPNAAKESLPSEKKSRQLLPSKFSLLFGAAAILAIVLGAAFAIIIPKEKTAPTSSSSTASSNGDFSIKISSDKTELGPNDKATVTITVTSVGGFSNKVKLTPVLDWTPPFIGIIGVTVPQRNVNLQAGKTATTVLYIESAKKLPRLENNFAAKSIKVKGESGAITRESNVLMIKTKENK